MTTTEFERQLEATVALAQRIQALGEAQRAEVTQEDARRRRVEAVAVAVVRCRDEAFDVAVVGEMKAGKSTLLNALVFGRELLPAATTVCTAKLATVEYAESFQGTATFVDRAVFDGWERQVRDLGPVALATPEGRALQELVRGSAALGPELHRLLGQTRSFAENELGDYMAVDGRFTPIVREVQLAVKHPLGPKVRLVDTPGLWDPDPTRSKLTIDYLHRASVVIVAMYAGAPMSQQDYEMIAHHLMGAGLDRILVVLNKMDTVEAGRETAVVEYVDAKLREIRTLHSASALANALANARALPVSGLLGLIAATRGRCTDGDFHEGLLAERYGFQTYEEAWALSGLDPLSAAIRELIATRDGSVRIGSVVQKGRALMDDVQRTAEQRRTEADRSLADLNATTEELRRRSENLADSIRALADRLGGAQSEIDQRLNDLRPTGRDLTEAIKAACHGIRAVGEREISQIGWGTAFSAAKVIRLNTELGWEARKADDAMRRVFDRFVKDIAAEMPEAFRHLREKLGSALPPELQFHIDRLQYVTSVGAPDFQPPLPPQIDQVGFWGTILTPTKAQETLRSALQRALHDWEPRALDVAKRTEAGFRGELKAAWIDGAFRALQSGLEGHKEDLRRSRAAVDGSLADRELRRTELIAARDLATADAAAANTLLESLLALQATLGVPANA